MELLIWKCSVCGEDGACVHLSEADKVPVSCPCGGREGCRWVRIGFMDPSKGE